MHAYTTALSADKLSKSSVANKTAKESHKGGYSLMNKDNIDKTRLMKERRDKVLEAQYERGNQTLDKALKTHVQRGISPINFRHAHGGVILGSNDNSSMMTSEKQDNALKGHRQGNMLERLKVMKNLADP